MPVPSAPVIPFLTSRRKCVVSEEQRTGSWQHFEIAFDIEKCQFYDLT